MEKNLDTVKSFLTPYTPLSRENELRERIPVSHDNFFKSI